MLEQKFDFLVVKPATPEYREYLSLRHSVFCDELRRIPSAGQVFGGIALESDEFDNHSRHVICRHRETGVAVGCARLIMPSARGLNIQGRYRLTHAPGVAPSRVGEIGRLAITSELRRQRGELSKRVLAGGLPVERTFVLDKRDGPQVALGLYRELIRQATQHGITHCYAAMEPSLARLLGRIGFPFHAVGPLNERVYPPKQPFMVSAHAIRSTLSCKDSCLYTFLFGSEGRPRQAFA